MSLCMIRWHSKFILNDSSSGDVRLPNDWFHLTIESGQNDQMPIFKRNTSQCVIMQYTGAC